MSNNPPKMMSIRDLDSLDFEIPVYQRGFRWTRQQIKELIYDLYDFSNSKTNNIYSLQNVTVRKKNIDGKDVFEVIDGQQRLTALWILIMAFIGSKKYEGEKMPIYTLNYEKKELLTEYVSQITEVTTKCPGTEAAFTLDHPKDIDACYINDAFKYLPELSKKNDVKYGSVLSKIFGSSFFDDSKRICIIWNEIDPLGQDESAKEKYVIDRFSNLNANKIPLTESELIKAYFINSLPKNKVDEFAIQWEEIERNLNKDELWEFITSGEYAETRMDFLFRVFLHSQGTKWAGQHSLSRVMSEQLTDEKRSFDVWSQILTINYTLLDWYNNYYYYHMIGLLVAVEDEDASSVIDTIYKKYNEMTKEAFKGELKRLVRTRKCYKIPFLRSPNSCDWEIERARDILLEGSDNSEISYIRNNKYIKPILLLFNISLLVNAYNVNPENSAERFSFKIYKSTENPIEIEHINPHHLEGKKHDGSEYTSEEKKNWALSTLKIIEDESRRVSIEKKVTEANWKSPNRSLVEELESLANLDSLNNLTLLDKNLNIRYGDNFFKEKRSHILAARFGNPIPFKEDDTYYEQSVIFPGTMWVFMRQFANSNTEDSDRWSSSDRREYIKCMQESIYRLLSDTSMVNNESMDEVKEIG